MKFAKIRQLFPHNELGSVADTFASILDSGRFQKAIAARNASPLPLAAGASPT